jgi:hypothetical protein
LKKGTYIIHERARADFFLLAAFVWEQTSFMRLWKILLALLLALTGTSPSALASIPLAQENLCTGPFRGVVSGYRYYNPAQGRWIGRDSAGEYELDIQQGHILTFNISVTPSNVKC